MSLSTFDQWLNERGKRTALGIYPPAYGTSQYPPLYFSPISAGATLAFATTHADVHPELMNKEILADFKKFKKQKEKEQKKAQKEGEKKWKKLGM